MTPSQRHRIEATTNQRIVKITYLEGGSAGEVWQVDLANGSKVIAKTAIADNNAYAGDNNNSNLNIEAYMLRFLTKYTCLPLPKIISDDKDLLIMEMIINDGSSSIYIDTQAANHLVKLHNITNDKFGFDRNTLIGPLLQPNIFSNDWISFFANYRLRYFGDLCFKHNKLPQASYEKLLKLCDRLDNYLIEPNAPSLIHGDLWAGNILTNNGKIAAFIDPAIYYANREIELAYIILFNSFGQSFFDRYQEQYKLDNDFFDVRAEIYNLYPLLVHVALYGGDYVKSVHRTLCRFI